MMYKKSNYNYVYEVDNEVFIYNLLYRSFVKMDKISWEQNYFEKQTQNILVQYGILLDESIDEYEVLKNIMYEQLYSKKSIGIFLSMTSQCNFNCPYCYQDCRKDMNDNVFIEKDKVDILCTYLQKYIKKNRVENLAVVFFGGEPTLQEEKLIYAIDKINSLKNVNKSFSIITNGYLIGDNLIEKLRSIKNFMVQITLDGYGELHDKNRSLKNGKPTFKYVYENIKKLEDKKAGNIVVRINVDLEKLDYYYQMVDSLAKDGMDKILYQLDFAAIFDGQKKQNCNHARENGEIYKLNKYAREKGFHVCYNVISGPCMTHSGSSFAVDENLKVYNCPGSLYTKHTAHINENGDLLIDNGAWYYDILNTKECTKSCIYAPICYGGCTMNNTCYKQNIESKMPYYIEDKIQEYKRGDK